MGGQHMPNVDGGSLWELVERRAAATPDVVAAVDEDGRTLTWAESKAAAERAAAGLARMGIGAGDVVSWQLPTWLESKVLVLALARLGAIQNPMLPIYREREVGFVTRQAKAQAAGRAVQLERLRLRGHGPGHRRPDRRRGRVARRCWWPTRPCPRVTRPR